ncbi:MAG: alkaline phosphatase family protein [Deltaproteobacteria bacterium]|nr:alkaline phosphatase family protein [Deltaproteobacteria bacterium]
MSRNTHSRRDFIKATAGGALMASLPLGAKSATNETGRPQTIVLGFDGVDPRLAERWIASGDLPNLAALQKQGWLSPLASTSPPNSPVAWTTFATGRQPLEHGVFGFLRRDPKTYLPGTAPYTITPPAFSPDGVRKPKAVSHRNGPAFWEILDQRKVPLSMLFVPYAYPPPNLPNGRIITGLGTPDARFTNSSFTLFTSEPAEAGSTNRVAGGRIVRLNLKGSTAETGLEGPRGPDKKNLSVGLRLGLNRAAGTLKISLAGDSETLSVGRRSKWFRIKFEAGGFELAGRVRFHLIELKKELRLYASPIQFDPRSPAMPLGSPPKWLTEAVATHGGLPTVGWVHDTSAVNAGVLPKEVFLADILDTMTGRAELLLREISSGFASLIISVFTGTDRAAHIFYKETARKDGGPLLDVYRKMDQIIGRVSQVIRPGTRLVVLSDHGFHAFNRMLHVNTWLESQGFLTRKNPGGAVQFLRGISWQKTMAYSMGNGQMYVNLLGRESKGSVTPGAPKCVIMETIRGRLLDLKDPASGKKPVRAVYDVYAQASKSVRRQAPDLQIAFAPGYRSSWETSLGGAPNGSFLADNPKHWCGDHAASDVQETPGFIAANSKLAKKEPRLIDIANTLLNLYGAPGDGPGRSLLI